MSILANRTPEGILGTTLGRIRETSIFIGVVKRNDDAQRMGRIAVWIPELGGSPDDEQSWFILSYASPFAGVTPSSDLSPEGETMEDGGGQMSYGFWMQPPDLDNHVLCCFANGDAAKGFWFACLYQQNMNHMVPGIPSGKPYKDEDTCSAQPPVIEYNKADDEPVNDPRRAIFTPLHEGLSKQGLYSDPIRGPSSTGARREGPSKAYGWLTPRGNTIHVDDNPDNEFIRMRTRSGAQILVHETDGSVYINSKTGNSWVSISDHGVDIYSQGSVSVRSEGSLNLHADTSLNIEADGNLNLRAGGNLTIQSANHLHVAGNGNLALQLGGKISASAAGELHLGAGGSIRMGAGGQISQSSSGENIRSASHLRDNDGGAPAPSLLSADVAKPRELPETIGVEPCFEQTTRKTITRRLPTHEPYAGHVAGEGGGGVVASSDEFASTEDITETNAEGNGDVVPDDAITSVSDNDADWLAICLYTEASGESDDGKAAVAQVIKNRMANRFRENKLNPAWNGQIKQYVLAYAAFSYFWSSNGRTRDIVARSGDVENPNGAHWRRAEQRGLRRMSEVKDSAIYKKCKLIAQQVLAGTYNGQANFQSVRANRGCNWYVNLRHARPAWLNNLRRLVAVGNHTFYIR